jgi:hypothetical protein
MLILASTRITRVSQAGSGLIRMHEFQASEFDLFVQRGFDHLDHGDDCGGRT